MYFCPVCSGLLVPEQAQSISLTCTACPYIYRLAVTLSNSTGNETKTIERVMGEEDELRYANKCEIQCPKCPNGEAMFLEMQTRSADEPMTIFYQCTKCHHDWKE